MRQHTAMSLDAFSYELFHPKDQLLRRTTRHLYTSIANDRDQGAVD